MHDSSFGRLIGALVAPGRTFQSIAQRPTWVVPMLVLVLLSTGTAYLMFQRVDFMEIMREQMADQGRPVPSEMEQAGGFMQGCYTAAFFLGSIAIPLAGAAFFLLFNFFGGKLRYPVSLSVLLHSMMPLAVSSLLTLPIILSRDTFTVEEVQGGRLLPSSLAVLAPEDAGPQLLALLSSVNFFSLWCMVLLVIGYSLAARVSKTTVAITVLSLWVLFTLVTVGLAGLAPGGGRG
jgi:hypothetical protein